MDFARSTRSAEIRRRCAPMTFQGYWMDYEGCSESNENGLITLYSGMLGTSASHVLKHYILPFQ